MKNLWLIAAALPLLAAAPMDRPLTLGVPADGGYSLQQPAPRIASARPPSFLPAPLPNRDVSTPAPERATNETTLAPTLFTTRTQFRGDGFSPGSTAQSEQEKKTRPGAGFSLHMPFAPQ